MCLKPIPNELQEELEEKLIRYELVRQQVCEKLDVSIDDLCEECKQKLKQDTSPLFDTST